MNSITLRAFRPRDGALLDLASLEALADAPGQLLEAALVARWPGIGGVVLDGFELTGRPSPAGPPGTVRPDAQSAEAVVSPGTALLRGRDGRMHRVTVGQALHLPWPDASGPRVRGALVLYAEGVGAMTEEGVAVARDELTVRVGFVRPEAAEQAHLVQLASAIGNGQDWATDLARVLQPEHLVIQTLLKRLERLDQSVWNAEPEGSVWDRQVLGRSWVRYQTVAASALQAARILLSTQATTTLERVRLLSVLRQQLDGSVERVATELLQLVGPVEGAGPYRAVVGSRR